MLLVKGGKLTLSILGRSPHKTTKNLTKADSFNAAGHTSGGLLKEELPVIGKKGDGKKWARKVLFHPVRQPRKAVHAVVSPPSLAKGTNAIAHVLYLFTALVP